MKKNIVLMIALLFTGTILFAGGYNLNESESVNLSGVDEILFDLRGPKCALCVNTLDVFSSLKGDGSGNDLILSLDGNITSNRSKAVPTLIFEKSGTTLYVRIFTDERTFFGLSQRGKARFEGLIPASYRGDITALVSSGDIAVESIRTNVLTVESSSGDMFAGDILCERISLELSSGDLEADELTAREELIIKSSSGELQLGAVNSENIEIKASSGDISIETLLASRSADLNSSSGEITAEQMTSRQLNVKTSSGKIGIERLETIEGTLDASSGDIILGTVESGTLDLKLTSGDLRIASIQSGNTQIKTSGESRIGNLKGALKLRGSSGDVELGLSELTDTIDIDLSSGSIDLILPGNSALDIYMETSSGDKRSDFDITGKINGDDNVIEGQINGGGYSVVLKTSSGDIKLLDN